MIEPQAAASSTPGRLQWAIIIAALLASTAWFANRGPIYEKSSGLDFILVYSASRAWVHGENPYDNDAVKRAWSDSGGPADRGPGIRQEPSLIYPPTTLLMMVPFGVLPWSIAEPLWILSNIAFLAVSIGCIAQLAGFQARQRRTWMFVIAALLFMPVHTAFRHGQTPIYAMGLLALGFVVRRQAVGGLLLSLASMLKPQLGLPFLCLEVVRRRWWSLIAAIVIAMLVLAAAVAPLLMRSINWRASWNANIANFQSSGQGDPTLANPMRHQMINLHVALHSFTENRAIVSAIAFVMCATLAALFFRFWVFNIRHRAADLLLALSMVATLTLMVVYHRFYDGVALLFALGWAIRAVSERGAVTIPGWCVIVLLVPFFTNSATMLWWLAYDQRIPQVVTSSWLWNAIVMPHQSWALLLIAVCLIWAQTRVATLSRSA